MGVRIPTFEDVGTVDPRATGGIPSLPQESAVAAGQQALGAGLQKAGQAALTVDAYDKIAQVKMGRAMADANWFANAAQIDGDLTAETDINKIPDIQARYRQAAETAANAISDPGARQLWLAEQEKPVVAGEKGAQLKSLGLWREGYQANMLQQGDALARTGAQQDDPRAFGATVDRINDLANSAVQAGVLTPTQAHTFQRQNKRQLITGSVDNLLNKGRVDDANSLIDSNRDEFDPAELATLRNHVQTKGVGIVGAQIANDAMHGTTPLPGMSAGGAVGNAVERFLDLAEQKESGGRNIEQQVVGPNGGYNPSTGTRTGPSSASGNFQITDTTWKEFAPQAGIDLSKYPRAISAPYDVQRQVARTIATTSGVQHWTNYNAVLKSAAAKEGLPVSGPIAGGTTQPATAATPDQLVGQPEQQAPAPGQTPPPAQPPGMQDLANAEFELAQRRAAAIDRITADPRAQADPRYADAALRLADLEFTKRQAAIAAQKQAITANRNAAADGYVKRIIQQVQTGQLDQGFLNDLGKDQNLDEPSRENLLRLYQSQISKSPDGETAKYGPKFFDYYQRMLLPDSDPNKIRDPSQIMALAVPKQDGSQDLTLAGVDKLRQELQAGNKPERVGEQHMVNGALAYAKHQLSFEADYGMFKIPDPKGQDAFNIGFVPKFFDYYNQGVAAGKPTNELLSKDNIDKLISPLKRSPDELARDRLNAGAEAGATPGQSAAAPADLSKAGSLSELQGAVQKNPALRQQANGIALQHGWIRPDNDSSYAQVPMR